MESRGRGDLAGHLGLVGRQFVLQLFELGGGDPLQLGVAGFSDVAAAAIGVLSTSLAQQPDAQTAATPAGATLGPARRNIAPAATTNALRVPAIFGSLARPGSVANPLPADGA